MTGHADSVDLAEAVLEAMGYSIGGKQIKPSLAYSKIAKLDSQLRRTVDKWANANDVEVEA